MVKTIWVSSDVAEKLKALKEELGAESYSEVIRALLSRCQPRRDADVILVDVLEGVAALQDLAESDPVTVIVFIERKLSPLISQVYSYAKARLASEVG
ncbi:MAG: hypothetical protein QXQ60_06350 [Thermofilum sp.]